MTKLQMIKRANGSVSYSTNIPIAMINDLGWKKGDIINLSVVSRKLIVTKSGMEIEPIYSPEGIKQRDEIRARLSEEDDGRD